MLQKFAQSSRTTSMNIFKFKLEKACRSQQVNESTKWNLNKDALKRAISLVIFRRANCQGDFPVGNRVADAGGICIAEAHRNS